MSVCLTKSFQGREYTPVHVCDEIWPNNLVQTKESSCPNRAEVTKFMYEAMRTDVNSGDAHSEIKFFFSKEPIDVANITIINDEIVYGYRDNPLAELKNFRHSKLLNSIRDMFVCIESRSTTFESFCDFLVNGWGSDKSMPFYETLCRFLADIKAGDYSEIEDVLLNKTEQCYGGFFNCEEYCEYGFMQAICVRFFFDLYNLLSRTKSIDVHPLFLFACKNFGSTVSNKLVRDYDAYCPLACRAELRAYGQQMEGVLIDTKPALPRFFRWAHANARILFETTFALFFFFAFGASLSGGIYNLAITNPFVLTMGSFGIACFLAMPAIVSADAVYQRRENIRAEDYLYKGLQSFLISSNCKYDLPLVAKKRRKFKLRQENQQGGYNCRI